jgi:group I intron endonuclease
MGYIYKIINIISKKCYIGHTKSEDPNKRFKTHLNMARKGKGCPVLREAIKKYGEENFKFEVIIICFDEDRFHYEKEYIKKYNTMIPNGYNILEGGAGGNGFKGKKHSEETLKRISESSKLRLQDPLKLEIHKQNVVHYFKNPDNRLKHSIAMKTSDKWNNAVKEGRVGGASLPDCLRESTNDKISEGVKNYFKSTIDNKNVNIEKHRKAMAKSVGKSILQYDLLGNKINRFESIKEAGRFIGKTSAGSIQFVLSGKYKTAYGFMWKYES